MSAIERIFDGLREGGGKAYMPYVCSGDPDLDFTRDMVKKLAESGSDLFEIGIPFSDTVADGQVIQAASDRALKNGMTPKKAIALLHQLRDDGITAGIVPMTYYNIVFHYGVERFCEDVSNAGASGLIIPDVPFEENERLKAACEANGMDLIPFVTPATSEERMKKILAGASGFVYAVAVLGVTGARDSFELHPREMIARVKKASPLPVAVGFGISKPEHARAAAEAGADGVIEGSQLVKLYGQFLRENAFTQESRENALNSIGAHAREMKNALTAGKA